MRLRSGGQTLACHARNESPILSYRSMNCGYSSVLCGRGAEVTVVP